MCAWECKERVMNAFFLREPMWRKNLTSNTVVIDELPRSPAPPLSHVCLYWPDPTQPALP